MGQKHNYVYTCREPDFQTIKMGSRVLTKQKNQLWHRSIVIKMPENEADVFRIKFESNGNVAEVFVQDLLPLSRYYWNTCMLKLKISYLFQCIYYRRRRRIGNVRHV